MPRSKIDLPYCVLLDNDHRQIPSYTSVNLSFVHILNIDALSCFVPLIYTLKFSTKSKQSFLALSVLTQQLDFIYFPSLDVATSCIYYIYFHGNPTS